MPTRREVVRHAAAGLAVPAVGLPRLLRAQDTGSNYLIPLSMTDIRVAMPVTVEGQGPVLVALDTGGQLSLIDKDFADRLKLGTRGGLNLMIGGRLDRYDLRVAREVVFAGQFRQPDVVFAETEHVRFGEGVVASLAAGFLASFDSELDFAAMTLRVFPEGGPQRTGWVEARSAIEPARVMGLSPLLKADTAIAGQTVRAILDTGAPRPFIVTERLLGRLAPSGGNWSPASKRGNRVQRTVRLDRPASLGGLTVDRPLVASNDIGAFGSEMIVGLPVLQRLNLATSVRRGSVLVKVNGRGPLPPRYNMSGLWIDRDGGRIVAGAVGRGSPAERAGVAVGDELAGLPFGQMIKALNGPAGSTVALEVGKSSARRSVSFVLSDYL